MPDDVPMVVVFGDATHDIPTESALLRPQQLTRGNVLGYEGTVVAKDHHHGNVIGHSVA